MKQPAGKRKHLEKKAIVLLADGVSIAATAKSLGTARSTIQRWLKKPDFAKAVEGAKGAAPKVRVEQKAQTSSPEDFREWVKDNYELSPADEQILDLAVKSLGLADNKAVPDSVRLQAMGRFQSLLKDLNLKVLGEEKSTPKPEARSIRKYKGDPRGVLGVVNN